VKVIRPFLSRIGALFRPSADTRTDGGEGPIEELWSPDRLDAKSGRFAEERGPTWASAWRDGRLDLELSKPGLLAWAPAESFTYDDFFVELSLLFPPGDDYVAAGLVFRQAEDDDFYLLLLSSKGYVRLDVVFNGTPRALVGWTEIPSRLASPRALASLGLIAQGSRFVILVDGEWVAEAEDETNRVGSLAFAARSFETLAVSPLSFSLSSILVESRKLEVEALRRRFTLVQVPEDAARRRLAETFVATGNFLAAAVQVDKIGKRRPLSAEELLLKAEIDLRLELLDDASAALDASLALDPHRPEAVLEKANLLYRRNLFPELRSFLEALPADFGHSARVALLLGHARSNLGDWAGAAAAYGEAARLEPEEPLLRLNEAQALEMSGDKKAAIAAWLEAGRGFFSRGETEELARAEATLARLDRGGPRHALIKARLLFLENKSREALALADQIIASGDDDAVVSYLAGLLRSKRGERAIAAVHYERACALAPDEALFAWRRAENLWLLGSPEARKRVEEALTRHPKDGWTLNLAARLSLESLAAAEPEEGLVAHETRAALVQETRRRLEAAVEALPGEKAPIFNLAEFLSIERRHEEALKLLAIFDDDPDARNQAGNIFARKGQDAARGASTEEAEASYMAAEREYRRALALDPSRAEFHENLAGVCVELGRWSDAEEEIRRALERGPGPRSYLLAGNLAELLGDWPRAEAAYRVGLEAFAEDRNLLLALGRYRLQRQDWKKARDCAASLAAKAPALAAALEAEIVAASTETLSCSSCGRDWLVPRNIPAQSGTNIRGMPPDEAPAGSCPRCGKIYCIACAKEHLDGNRFTCPDCGDFLKLSDNRLRFLVREAMKGQPTT